jgi:hypothetical protein
LSVELNNTQALHNLGVVAHHQRRHDGAIILIGMYQFWLQKPGG